MVRTSGPEPGNTSLGNVFKRLRRQHAKAQNLTKKAQKTASKRRQTLEQTDQLETKLDRQATRVAHAWRLTRKLQIKYHHLKDIRLRKQLWKMWSKMGKKRMTPKQEERVKQIGGKRTAEQRVISQIKSEVDPPL